MAQVNHFSFLGRIDIHRPFYLGHDCSTIGQSLELQSAHPIYVPDCRFRWYLGWYLRGVCDLVRYHDGWQDLVSRGMTSIKLYSAYRPPCRRLWGRVRGFVAHLSC
jgi:hypothetical protein